MSKEYPVDHEERASGSPGDHVDRVRLAFAALREAVLPILPATKSRETVTKKIDNTEASTLRTVLIDF